MGLFGGYGTTKTGQALWLMLANTVSLCMTFVISAFFSRYMTAVEYGTYRQVIYIYSTLLMVFSFGLPNAYSYFFARVPLEEGKAVIRKLNLLFFLLSAVFSVILFTGASLIAGLLANPLLTVNLKYFAVIPMLLMPVLGVEYLLTVYGKARAVFVYVLVCRGFTVLCSVIPVCFFNTGVSGAIIGMVMASFVTLMAGMSLMALPFKNAVSVKTEITIRDILHFSIPVFTSSLYGFVIDSASQFFVSRYLGVEQFALFANGYKELPLAGIVIGAIAGILLPEYSRMAKNGAENKEYVILWKNVVQKSASVIYPFTVFCCIFAPGIMGTLYGAHYREAAALFRIVTVINLVRIVPYGPVMFALGKGKIFANAHLVTAVLLIGADFLCVAFFPSVFAIAAIATAATVFCLFVLMLSMARILAVSLSDLMPWKSMLKILSASVVSCSLGSISIKCLGISHDFLSVSVGFLLSAILYFPISRFLGIDYTTVLKPLMLFQGMDKLFLRRKDGGTDAEV